MEHDSEVEPEPLGGDQKYSFYGLSTTKGYFVLIVVNDYTDPEDPAGSANPALLDVIAIGEVARGTT